MDGEYWGYSSAVGYEYCSHPFSHRRSDFLSTCGEWCGESKRDLRRLFRKSLRFLVGGTGLEPVASAL